MILVNEPDEGARKHILEIHTKNIYIDTFVVCQECNRPDTSFQRAGRTLNLSCEACGAKRPIRTNLIA